MPHSYPLPGVWLTTEEAPLVANVTNETRTLAAQIQEAAKQLSLSTATGDSLDRFASMMGISRQRFEPAAGSVVPLPFEESDAQLRARMLAIMNMGNHIARGNVTAAIAAVDEEDDALDAAALLGGTDAVVAMVQAEETTVDKGAAAIARAREAALNPWWSTLGPGDQVLFNPADAGTITAQLNAGIHPNATASGGIPVVSDPNCPPGQAFVIRNQAQANAAFGSGSALANSVSGLFTPVPVKPFEFK